MTTTFAEKASVNSGSRDTIRTLVRGGYDLQKLRIQMGNRVVANFKARLGQKPGMPEEELDDESLDIIKDIRARYRKMMDSLAGKFPKPADFTGDEVISSFTELCVIQSYVETEAAEKANFKRVESALEVFPIYTEFLRDVRGIGPMMAGVIVSEFDIRRAKYPSSLWAYAGLDVAGDGMGRSRKKEHLVDREYQDKDGKTQTRVGITFNPWLKTKLIGVLASSFIKSKSPWREIYDDYKHRLESHAKWGTHNDKVKDGDVRTSKGRRDAMAKRYMVKMFLIELYKRWRAIEGLVVYPPYHEAKLGLKHGAE